MSFLKRDNSDENRQFYSHVRIVAREAFLVMCGLVILIFIFIRFNEFTSAIRTVEKSLQGIIFGFVLAYLLDPLVKIYRKGLSRAFRKVKDREKRERYAKGIAIGMGIASGILMLVALVGLIIPSLVESITHLVGEMSGYAERIQEYINHLQRMDAEWITYLSAFTESVMETLQAFITSKIAEWSSTIMATLGNGLVGFLKTLVNLLVGFVIAVYLLRDKNLALSLGKKLLYTFFKKERADNILDVLRHAHGIFGGFIIGKLIDSLIIGLITAVFCVSTSMPYALLISVIVGVTNIIPFFGPFIGAIPSALLILVNSPIKCLIFVVFILVLQQIDGNIIGPRILGDRINLNEFWVTFAILLFGGVFGLFGMVAGVPIFATLYYVIGRWVNMKLEKKGLPTETRRYRHMTAYADLKVDEKTEKSAKTNTEEKIEK